MPGEYRAITGVGFHQNMHQDARQAILDNNSPQLNLPAKLPDKYRHQL
jgi:hypothetical protein